MILRSWWCGTAHLFDCGVVVMKFSLPLAGSTLMVTRFGLGVLAVLMVPAVSETRGILVAVLEGASLYGAEAATIGTLVRAVVVLVMD
jgi:hypothetical protein